MGRRCLNVRLACVSAVVLASAIATSANAACRFEPQGDGKVAAIIDASTFRLEDGREVRLAGIVSPDSGKNPAPRTLPLAASIAGRHVTLHGPSDAPDRYGRQPAFVFEQGSTISVQEQLLSTGDALIAAAIPEKDCEKRLAGAERIARLERRGVWGNTLALKNAESSGDILTRIGLFTMIEGTVISTRASGAMFYINFGKRWTRDFAVTVSRRIVPAFEAAGVPLNALERRRIRIRGWIEQRGGPRIDVTWIGQIEMIDRAEAVAKGDGG